MAMNYGDQTYGNALRSMLTNPNSFSGSPGFNFSLNTGLDAVSRQAAARGMNQSGNVLGDLTKYATGLASQDYGNQFNRLQQANQSEQNYDLGQQQANLGQGRLALDTQLGQGQLALGQGRLGLDTQLGMGQLGLGQQRLGLDRELGMGNLALDTTREGDQYNLGLGNLQNNAQRNANDFLLGGQRNAIDQSQGQNQFNLGMFNAQTQRGNALTDAYYRNRAANPQGYWAGGSYIQQTPRYY